MLVRTQLIAAFVWPALALGGMLGACGGIAEIDPSAAGGGGTGGTGGIGGIGGIGGTGGTGGTGGAVPPECAVSTSAPPPYAVTFQLHNPGFETLYVREQCWPVFAISACVDGYSRELELWPGCSVDCADPSGGCIACEMCLEVGIPIEPGQSHEVSWPGLTYTFDTNQDGCMCHDDHAEPAGLHRITVPVYLTAQAAELDDVAYEVSTDFPLPAVQGVVVPVAMLR